MEFMCALSVDGSLATYRVKKKSENSYAATLRAAKGKQADAPSEITLVKNAAGWTAVPLHEEIVRGLVNAIEAKGSLDDESQSPDS